MPRLLALLIAATFAGCRSYDLAHPDEIALKVGRDRVFDRAEATSWGVELKWKRREPHPRRIVPPLEAGDPAAP